MDCLDLVRLPPLMRRTSGSPAIKIGLIDGPQAGDHATFVAAMLSAQSDAATPAICPGCPLLIRPLPRSTSPAGASPQELATSIHACIDERVRVINLSLGFAQPSINHEPEVDAALNRAQGAGVLVVASAGNQGTLGSSAVTRHPWVVPVAACNRDRRPMSVTNLGRSVGRRGVMAPGDGVTHAGPDGKPLRLSGTSVAAPFVTGTIALLWSLFPAAGTDQIKLALRGWPCRASVVPVLLDAEAAYQFLLSTRGERRERPNCGG